jgi:hypothetical protein
LRINRKAEEEREDLDAHGWKMLKMFIREKKVKNGHRRQ